MATTQLTNAQVLAHYYLREGYLNKVRTLCDEELRRSNDPALVLWKALALHSEGSTREAIAEAEGAVEKRDMGLPAASALVVLNGAIRDTDQVAHWTSRLRSEARDASEGARCLAAQLAALAGEYDQAQE
ncbi:unnamed protein product, partial [Prorocentrum cordatum]